MATSPQALTRQQLKTIAQSAFTAQSLDSNRIALGLVDFSPSTTFLQSLVSAGPYLVILPSECGEFNTTDKIMPYWIECVLWIGLTNWTSQDFTGAEDILNGTNGLITKWKDTSLYGSTCPAIHISPTGPLVRSDVSPMAVCYSTKLLFHGEI
jgi:hypothetical protein